MGHSGWLLGMVCSETVPDSLVRDVVEAFWENSFTTHVGQGRSIAAVADRIHGRSTPSPGGSFEVWYAGDDEYPHSNHTYTVECHLDEPVEGIAPVTISGPGEWLDHTTQDHDVQAQVEALVDAFVALAESIDPWVAVLAMMPDGGMVPAGHPPDHGLERLPFATVFGSEWFDHLESRDHVLAAPVYEARSLKTGSVLLRTCDRVVEKQPLDRGPTGSPEMHLFEGL